MAKQPKRPTRAQKIAASKAAKEPKTETPERAKRDFIGQQRLSDDLEKIAKRHGLKG